MIEKNLPLVSVIVPCYNHEKYVTETIESIVNQTYKNIELIVIDDGSKDNSPKILAELSEKYNFNLIVRENKGLSATLNEGIKLSEGKYICVCASDDIYLLNKITTQVEFMEANPKYMISYGKKINFHTNDLKINIENKHYRSGNIFKDLLLQKILIPPASVLYRKEVFENLGGFDIDLAVEDVDMFLRIGKKYQIGYQNEYFYYYRVHPTNTINDIEKMEFATTQILNKWKDEPLYPDAIYIKNMRFFKYYAATQKLESLQRLPKTYKVLNQKMFYEGLFRLLIPTFLYKLLKKL